MNMKGSGEPSFEFDFPPGSDILAGIREGPKPAERMEYELFSRFAVSFAHGPSARAVEFGILTKDCASVVRKP